MIIGEELQTAEYFQKPSPIILELPRLFLRGKSPPLNMVFKIYGSYVVLTSLLIFLILINRNENSWYQQRLIFFFRFSNQKNTLELKQLGHTLKYSFVYITQVYFFCYLNLTILKKIEGLMLRNRYCAAKIIPFLDVLNNNMIFFLFCCILVRVDDK